MPTVTILNKQIQATPADAIVVNLFEGITSPGGATGAVDTALGSSDGVPGKGLISQLLTLGDFKGKLNDTAVIYTNGLIPSPRVIVVGLGKKKDFSLDHLRQASGAAVRKARELGCKRVATIVHGSGIGGMNARDAAQATIEGTLLGTYQFTEHKSKNGKNGNGKRLDEIIVVEYDKAKLDDVQAGAAAGERIANGVNAARTLINRAPNVLHPSSFAQMAQEMAQRVGLKCTVLTENEIAEQNMGGIQAVARGSAQPARMVIWEHNADAAGAPLIFIGKGVTFDTGGISIKPSEGMQNMKADMAGAAAVFGAMQAIAELKLPQRVIGITPLVENMPSDRAYRPGDVITMMSGLTVEILSTDAEGRMILADALHYAKRYNPRGVVDLATLTGACVIALGDGVAAGVFSNNEDWVQTVLRAADAQGEKLWQLPLYSEYGDKIRSDYAEIKNTGGRMGGVGTSAYFLKRFVEEGDDDAYPWAHIDMAGMTFSDSTRGYNVKGGMGYGVRMLVELAKG